MNLCRIVKNDVDLHTLMIKNLIMRIHDEFIDTDKSLYDRRRILFITPIQHLKNFIVN